MFSTGDECIYSETCSVQTSIQRNKKSKNTAILLTETSIHRNKKSKSTAILLLL